MNSNIKSLIIAGGAMLAMASCSENSWNDKYLKGFDSDEFPTDVRTVSYTLTASDYNRLANNRFNKLLASQQGVSDALAAVGTQHYLTPEIPADEYIPNLLKDSLFTYFALSDGSAINVTYREVGELPETMKAVNGAPEYVVTDEDYQQVYGSEDDYAASFSPSHSASSNIPRLLRKAYPDAQAGDYVIVNYDSSDMDPVFSAPDEPETPGFTLSNVLTPELGAGEEVTINGVVTAVCKAGIILTDNAGSILVYANGFPFEEYAVGDQVICSATTTYYKNCMQIAYSDNLEKVGTQAYTYPEASGFSPDDFVVANENSSPVLAQYGIMNGTVNVSGNYYNIAFDGRSDVRGSIYNATDAVKAMLPDGQPVKIYGYFTQTSTSKVGDEIVVNANFVVVSAEVATNRSARKAPRRVAVIPSSNINTAYTFNGTSWSADNSVKVLNLSDYQAMGLSYDNLSGEQPAQYLPIYLSKNCPYAQEEDTQFVAYKYYADKVTTYACSQWQYTGGKWVDAITANGVQEVTSQFVRNDGVWKLDPSITLTLPAGRNQPLSTWFFQATTDYVKDYIPNGAAYVTSYGNNEYYCGTSAYQGNIDLRPSAARNQYPEGYEGMTDEEIVAIEKKRFEDEVCPGTLSLLYPNMAPVGDFEPTVTINFSTYDGSTTAQTIIYKCVEKAKFEFVSCTWNNTEE